MVHVVWRRCGHGDDLAMRQSSPKPVHPVVDRRQTCNPGTLNKIIPRKEPSRLSEEARLRPDSEQKSKPDIPFESVQGREELALPWAFLSTSPLTREALSTYLKVRSFVMEQEAPYATTAWETLHQAKIS